MILELFRPVCFSKSTLPGQSTCYSSSKASAFFGIDGCEKVARCGELLALVRPPDNLLKTSWDKRVVGLPKVVVLCCFDVCCAVALGPWGLGRPAAVLSKRATNCGSLWFSARHQELQRFPKRFFSDWRWNSRHPCPSTASVSCI